MSAVEALADALYEDVPTLAGWQIDQVIECVVAAIRSMPAEQVAELIGGEVERGAPYGIWAGCIRVQTAWGNEAPPLGVSPETNAEEAK